jgi:hypothetical protein
MYGASGDNIGDRGNRVAAMKRVEGRDSWSVVSARELEGTEMSQYVHGAT